MNKSDQARLDAVHATNEEWLAIHGYKGTYEVSNLGHVRSLNRIDTHGQRRIGKVLRPGSDKDGYRRITLSNGRFRESRKIYHLVLEAFLGPRPDGMHGCHNDGDCRNDQISNLRWDTPTNNQRDKFLHGTDIRGERSPNAKLNALDIEVICYLSRKGFSGAAIARWYGLSKSCVCRIVRGNVWQHLGFAS
jgi:hypothetical protein